MTARADLLRRLAAVADDVGVMNAPTGPRRQLQALCHTARLAFRTRWLPVARLEGDTLVYEAADGRGGELIIGTRLPDRSRHSRIRGPHWSGADHQSGRTARPRFARGVAERVGYVPDSILATPIVGDRGDVIGVLSVLDRRRQGSDTLAIASAFADHAALVLPQIDLVIRLAPILLHAVAEAISQDDDDLARALRRQAADSPTTPSSWPPCLPTCTA